MEAAQPAKQSKYGYLPGRMNTHSSIQRLSTGLTDEIEALLGFRKRASSHHDFVNVGVLRRDEAYKVRQRKICAQDEL